MRLIFRCGSLFYSQYLLGAPLDDPRKVTADVKASIFRIEEMHAKRTAAKTKAAEAAAAAAAAAAEAAAAAALNPPALGIQGPNAPAVPQPWLHLDAAEFAGLGAAGLDDAEGGGQGEPVAPAVQAPDEALPQLQAAAPVEVDAPPEDMEID